MSDTILGPIAASLQGEWQGRRLAIVPTGALEYVPFAALPAPMVTAAISSASAPVATPTDAPRPWLVDTHEIVRLPSMSALALLRHETMTRPAASHTIAVLADPVYSTDDPRVRARFQTRRERDRDVSPRDGMPGVSLVSPKSSAPVATALASAAFGRQAPPPRSLLRGTSAGETPRGFARLVFSREEAQAIVKLARAGDAFEALDFTASRATMASPAVANGARDESQQRDR